MVITVYIVPIVGILTTAPVTEKRFTDSADRDSPIIEDIRPMKASCRDFQKEKRIEDEKMIQMGFIQRLWSEIFSARAN